jgi:hypothetical protein
MRMSPVDYLEKTIKRNLREIKENEELMFVSSNNPVVEKLKKQNKWKIESIDLLITEYKKHRNGYYWNIPEEEYNELKRE